MEEKYSKDIDSLYEIAKKQGAKINLSVILITLNCPIDDISEIVSSFEENGITVLNEDVEPDYEDETLESKVIPFDPLRIDIKMDKITVDSIIKRINNNELEFDSSFQRKSGLWSVKQKSQLIESIFLKIPLPAFYFDASDDDKWQIIDGLQRIGTIKEYVVDKSFALTGLEFLKDFDKLKFNQLPRAMQRRIEETNLNAYLVNPSTPKNVKFNIFKRINTGGLVLEPQEIRNALYQGKASKSLLQLSKVNEFREATDFSIKADRMLDREFCLRYVAFTQLDFENNYTGNMDDFLNLGMEYLGKLSSEDYNMLESSFRRNMVHSKRIFSKYAFRRIADMSRRGPVNKAIFEIWSSALSTLSEEQIEVLVLNNDVVMQKFSTLCNNYSFQNAIRAADKTSVSNRLLQVKSLVWEVLERDTND